MNPEYKPDEFLMKQVETSLRKGSNTIPGVCKDIIRHPKNVRQALNDLIYYGKVAQCPDGYRYELVQGGYSPGPEAA
jgi:hypothetical protein